MYGQKEEEKKEREVKIYLKSKKNIENEQSITKVPNKKLRTPSNHKCKKRAKNKRHTQTKQLRVGGCMECVINRKRERREKIQREQRNKRRTATKKEDKTTTTNRQQSLLFIF